MSKKPPPLLEIRYDPTASWGNLQPRMSLDVLLALNEKQLQFALECLASAEVKLRDRLAWVQAHQDIIDKLI